MNRRRFIKAGAAGMVSGFVLSSSAANVLAATGKEVRIAFIGVGGRGRGMLNCMFSIPGWKVAAICDINESNLQLAINMVEGKKGYKPEGYSKGPEDYKRMVARDDVDAVFIATPAPMHARMAVDCMLAGKHVGTEVPAAYTLDECWELVNVKEKTGRHFMLLENYNYAHPNMVILNMVKQHVFGETYFAECSYIHDVSNLRYDSKGNLTWRGEVKIDGIGNLYPTHAIGPVAKWLGINRGDIFVRQTSYMSKPAALHAYAVKRFGKDSDAAKIDFKAGDMCTTQIQTHNGSLINIQYDTESKRPVNNYYLLQGTEGVYDSRNGIHFADKSKHGKWDSIVSYYDEYDHPLWKKYGAAARKTGHGGGDYFVVKEFIESLIEDREPWIDVYDAVAWSAILELSQQSIRNNNAAVDFPDFTRGKWKNRADV